MDGPEEQKALEGTVIGPDGAVRRYPDAPGPPPPPPAGPRTRPGAPRGELLKALQGGPKQVAR
jgi:hypothetical protein